MNTKKDEHKKKKFIAALIGLAVLAASVSAPLIMAANAAAVNDFVIPVQIANPQTPDEEFFNMRLDFFLPETEPLIKETFGSTLRFEDAAFWEYESYYSRAVSFATNLPTLAKIEYGPDTNYEFSTTQTEFYYYQHLFHLTGLEPGHTYHYRIKAMGSDGQLLTSSNYTFTTPQVPADIIRVPQDLADKSLPYKLNGNDKKYLLTEDIYAPHGGIILSGYNVMLDLGGHTIIYDNVPNPLHEGKELGWNDFAYNMEQTFGVRLSLWNLRNHKVFNGTIIQGKNGGIGVIGHGYNPIYGLDVNNVELAGITADFYGESINGFFVGGDANVHHNVIYDRGDTIDNRHTQIRAITFYGLSNNTVFYNSVRRCRQTGIAGALEACGNEVYGDSFAPNSFLLGYNNNCKLWNNKIFGLGHNPNGIGGGTTFNAAAWNNFIYLNAYAPTIRDFEYNRYSWAVGFRWQIYGDQAFTGTYWDNNTFTDNVVIVKVWENASTVRGITMGQSEYARNNRVDNNIVKVEAMNEDCDYKNGGASFTCVEVQSSIDSKLFQVDFDINSYAPSAEIAFTGNRFITNLTFFLSGGSNGIGANASFYRNTYERIDSFPGLYMPFRLGYWYYHTVNNKIIDPIASPGVDLTQPVVHNAHATSHLQLAIGVSSQRAYIDAATGAVLANKTIQWEMDGGVKGAFTTDSKGEAAHEWITTMNEHVPNTPRLDFQLAQTHNTTVTFTADGYAPLIKNISDLQGAGEPIKFFVNGGEAQISGKVLYHAAYPNESCALVSLKNNANETVASVKTLTDGTFMLCCPITTSGNNYSLVISKPGYLTYTIENIALASVMELKTIDLRQLAGDVNGDGFVNAEDLTYLLSVFNKAPVDGQYADFDGNGIVNAVDLTYLLAGFNKQRIVVTW